METAENAPAVRKRLIFLGPGYHKATFAKNDFIIGPYEVPSFVPYGGQVDLVSPVKLSWSDFHAFFSNRDIK
jgi:hypothetical protein